MEHRSDTEKLISICRSVEVRDPLENISNYNDKMTISQVVRFFERQGIHFTKTMIQNYIRQSVLPPPYEKRYYTKEHLLLLTIIDGMKEVYSLEEIRELLQPSAYAPGGESETNPAERYARLLQIYRSAVSEWIETVPGLIDKAAGHLQDFGAENDSAAQSRMAVLLLMAQSAAIKKSIRLFME